MVGFLFFPQQQTVRISKFSVLILQWLVEQYLHHSDGPCHGKGFKNSVFASVGFNFQITKEYSARNPIAVTTNDQNLECPSQVWQLNENICIVIFIILNWK